MKSGGFRGIRVTIGTILGLMAVGRSHDEILQAYPYLESEDLSECLEAGALVTINESRSRVRILPFS